MLPPERWQFDPCAPVPGAKPCLGSGLCCKTGPCHLAAVKYPDSEAWTLGTGCPSLIWDEKKERFLCGEIVNAATDERREWTKQTLYAGAGCCMGMFNTVRSLMEARLPLRFDPETGTVTVDPTRIDTSSL